MLNICGPSCKIQYYGNEFRKFEMSSIPKSGRGRKIVDSCWIWAFLQFHGVCCDEPPVCIVMELCTGGSLDNHLQQWGDEIVTSERVLYSFEAAKGMSYLQDKFAIIHILQIFQHVQSEAALKSNPLFSVHVLLFFTWTQMSLNQKLFEQHIQEDPDLFLFCSQSVCWKIFVQILVTDILLVTNIRWNQFVPFKLSRTKCGSPYRIMKEPLEVVLRHCLGLLPLAHRSEILVLEDHNLPFLFSKCMLKNFKKTDSKKIK